MSEQTIPSSHDARTERYLGVLDLLVTRGVELVTRLQEPGSPPEDTVTPDLIDAFERISRSIRRTMLLARKLAEPLPKPRDQSVPPSRAAARKRIIRNVGDAIELGQRTKGIDVDSLEAELLDRLDRPDIEDDIATRPIDDIIADIARDLGVGYPANDPPRVWKRRTPEDIQALELHAAAPLPAGPRPPRTATRTPSPNRIVLPEDDAQAIAMVLAIGNIRDG